MNRVLKWAGYGLAGVVGACVLAVGGAFAVSEAMIRWPVEKPQATLVASSDPGAVARGKRVATLNGCHDCHGKTLEGQLFHDERPGAPTCRGRWSSRRTPTSTAPCATAWPPTGGGCG